MQLKSLHFLLTYKCTTECAHCFVFGSPKNKGCLAKADLLDWIEQASKIQTVKWIFFEGGEPFLYPELLSEGLRAAKGHGLSTGIVTNGYWARSLNAGTKALEPIAGLIDYMQISSDELHGNRNNEITGNAIKTANASDIDCSTIEVTVPRRGSFASTGDVLFKGRAALKLAEGINTLPWDSLTACNDENLVNPSRLHIDQFGHAHICQGLVIGNLNKTPLRELVDAYDHNAHPIISLIERGGPALLAKKLGAHHVDNYVDQCQLCYLVRKELSKSFPDHLAPAGLYLNN